MVWERALEHSTHSQKNSIQNHPRYKEPSLQSDNLQGGFNTKRLFEIGKYIPCLTIW